MPIAPPERPKITYAGMKEVVPKCTPRATARPKPQNKTANDLAKRGLRAGASSVRANVFLALVSACNWFTGCIPQDRFQNDGAMTCRALFGASTILSMGNYELPIDR